jgi:cysteinyl-tRNA synthetase
LIRLFNSMTQQKEPFEPREPGKVGVYSCGPTVYNLVHVGNARPYVTFAVLRSWLSHRGFDVRLVTNITDVDDKIIRKAKDEGREPAAVAEEYTAAYVADTDRLGIPRPDVEPKATETIPEIIDLVSRLVELGHAYEVDGSVYFSVRSFPDYGKLSKQRIDELEEGVRVDNEPGKADPLDFALWKAAKPGEPAWKSPWGMGRPGWHIECSAMSLQYLGAGFDVHGGGRDLIFPHHENEIAQSEAAGLPFARFWMHNGMIRSEGEKMAKSVGNIFLLREVLDRYGPAVVLTYFLTTHYRSPLEFSTDKLDEAKAAYGRLADALADIDFRVANASRATVRGEHPDLALRTEAARVAFGERMDDDLNTAAALGELFALVGEMHKYLGEVDRGEAALDTGALLRVSEVLRESLGVLLIPVPGAAPSLTGAGTVAGEDAEACVTGGVALLPATRLAEEGRWEDVALVYADRLACEDASYACVLRDHYRADKRWADADRLRDEMQAAGFVVRDTPQGTQVVRKQDRLS